MKMPLKPHYITSVATSTKSYLYPSPHDFPSVKENNSSRFFFNIFQAGTDVIGFFFKLKFIPKVFRFPKNK
ncbi:MAG: hypothetical protein A3H98_12385 [Bacteroidetes bacterium RIFCSPLOWO2_02_FULL_36_8]|nr:MAG: hypothetical protein A3H98_12385 [Bacteroidetes bacterium RIFCSPLOWO2_02_FULL_36_8]OFY71092.1 MAG: hypothetical protein A3G23_14880 [Bacteroidetes bacterium RIFCSPLOWO2_12_FULL_37_12]